MEKINFAFGQKNYIICIISIVLIILGFVLMTGPASTIESGFEPDIFSTRRITVAPMISFFGFLLMIVGILFPKGKVKEEAELNVKADTTGSYKK